jgi:predicted TIM-barrel fold metal-dependent hydrolase
VAGREQLKLVDGHHHLIAREVTGYPWIQRRVPALEALLDNYYDIAHDYDIDDYLADMGDVRLAASVACEFGAADPVAEARWVQCEADRRGFPQALIAAVDLTSPALGDVLATYRELPVVHAVRQPLYWAEDPLRRLGARPDMLGEAAWLRGFERIADAGLTWDLLVYDEQLPSAHELIGAFPQTRFALEAAGWPLDLGADGFNRWQDRMRAISEFPNVTLKLQGLALLFGPSADEFGPWARAAVEIFGADRCMFAAHFPVDRLLCGFDELVGGLLAALEGLGAEELAAFFAGCAIREYQLETGQL